MEESLEQIYKFYEDLFNNLPAGATEEVSMADQNQEDLLDEEAALKFLQKDAPHFAELVKSTFENL